MQELPILYDSFNARNLGDEQLAQLFIINSQFSELVKNNHSLLMGPRGSGKTTLLKMLTVSCQHYWNLHPKKIKEIVKPAFYAIYIPTDSQWKRQINELERQFQNKGRFAKAVVKLNVTTNILLSVCNTFIDIIRFQRGGTNALKNEARLAQLLVRDWKLMKPIAANLLSVRHSLFRRLDEIRNLINKVQILQLPENEIPYPDYIFDEYLPLLDLAFDSFEVVFRDDPKFKETERKWALCFDELEIAPSWLQEELFGMLRSLHNQRILLKLTMVPLVVLKDFSNINAREKDDYNIIRTWTYSSTSINNWNKFARKLIEDKMLRKSAKIHHLSLFGSDSLDRNLELTFHGLEKFEATNGYAEGSYMWFLFKELAAIDSSFRDYLKDKDIIPSNPIPKEKGQEDSLFRKIKPIAVHRLQFKSHIVGKLRSRKNASLYYGIPRIFDLCDGNPRALIGLIDEFLDRITFEKDGRPRKFDISAQSRLITEVSKRYLLLLENHPDANVRYHKKFMNLGAILQKIGKYFESELISASFSADPYNCFIVDDKTPEEVQELLTVAMHLGAIIYLNPNESVSINGLIGKKFRLSYLLFPNFKLPMVEYKATLLSKIIKTDGNKIDQLLLFDAE